ncbi:MAG: FADH(2)-oxidizing methylenetetrahydrofolate--tRNA-(uracil(54)-C(5))-methyltransferase TrmFO, partial [Cetobacterium sp.]
LDDRSSIGAIIKYITEEKKNFQPMGPNFGVIKSLDERIRDKKEKYNKISKIALEYLDEKLNQEK